MHRLSVVLFVAACGGSSVADQPDAGLSAADACMQTAVDRCTKLMACSGADLDRRYGDLATCEAREQLTCIAALDAAGTGATPDTTLACGQAIAAEACTDYFVKAPPAACTTQHGTGTGTCTFPAQCASGFCAIADDSWCGTCAPQPAVGDSCATTGCGQTLVCVASTMLCQAPVASGGACSKSLPCADGYSCVGATDTASGVCTAEVATSGAACDNTLKTGPTCNADAGLTCDAKNKICVTQPVAAVGAACGGMNGIATRCDKGAVCDATTNLCVAPAADGAACDDSTPCFTPAKCVNGTCQLPAAATCD